MNPEIRLLAARTVGCIGILTAVVVVAYLFMELQDTTMDSFRDGEEGHIGWVATAWFCIIGLLALILSVAGLLSMVHTAPRAVRFLSVVAICIFVALLIAGAQTWLLSGAGFVVTAALFLINASKNDNHDA